MKKEILITGQIDKDVYSAVLEQTRNLTAADELNLRINSSGGNALDGLAIFDALSALPCKISAEILGVCASAATIVAAAATERMMSENALWMVHRAWLPVMGNADALREAAGLLEKIDARMVSIYAGITNRPESEIRSDIARDNYMSATAALSGGWITKVTGSDASAEAPTFDTMVADLKAHLSEPPKAHFSLAELCSMCANLFRSEEQKKEASAAAKLEELKVEHEKLSAELAAAKAAAAAAQEELKNKEQNILEREQLAVAAALKNIGADADNLPEPAEKQHDPKAENKKIFDIGMQSGLSAAIDAMYRTGAGA